MEKIDAPKLFISYSWSSPNHEQRVLELGTELRNNGVDVILDKWDLKEGQDAIVFMEKMVTDSLIKKVIMICDKKYVEKTDNRRGGVGTEAQIISKEIYDKVDQNKFVALVVEKDELGNAYLPVYYKSRKYIDLSSDSDYSKNFEQLLRWIFDKPFYEKPEIGKPPVFLESDNSISLNTSFIYKRLIESIRNQKENQYGLLKEYFNVFIKNFINFYIEYKDMNTFDDLLIENINLFLPYRNEFIEILNLLTLYSLNDNIISEYHKFFESLIPFLNNPKKLRSYSDCDFDNFKFIIHELFLYFITILLKNEKFEIVANILYKEFYYTENQDYGRSSLVHFSIFRKHLQSLQKRNERLKLNRLSLHADLLKERSNSTGINFNSIMQADFVLYIKCLLDSIINKNICDYDWFPITLLYMTHWPKVFEIFARSESSRYFDKVKVIFNIKNKDDFLPLINLFAKNKNVFPRFGYESINPIFLLNFEKLCTLP